MKVGDAVRLLERFPPGATLHHDGRELYVEVKKEGYFDLDCADKDLPWLNPPEPKDAR